MLVFFHAASDHTTDSPFWKYPEGPVDFIFLFCYDGSMKTTGIIAEYNPFHNGHLYQMQEARRLSGADYIIVVMSPDFVQRGAPSLIDKWVRARMALAEGADLVLELPVRCAAGSAEFFAYGGVSLLSSLGVVDALSFGCEAKDIALLEEYAHFLCQEEPAQYRRILKDALKEGKSFAQARCSAYLGVSSREEADGQILRSPNNILAVEYLKAVFGTGSGMRPVPVHRTGAAYHDRSIPGSSVSCRQDLEMDRGDYASASGIRSALSKGIDVRDHIPAAAYELLKKEISANRYLTPSDLDLPLHLKLVQARGTLSDYLDVSDDLANRIEHLLPQYTGFEPFTALLKTKQTAYTRISRALLHILLDIRKKNHAEEDSRTQKAAEGRSIFQPSYARVLGFRKSAQPLLAGIKKSSRIPLITKLPPRTQMSEALQEDTRAAELWELLVSHKTGAGILNERQRRIIIL